MVKKISAERVNRNRSAWRLTHIKRMANKLAGAKTIYQLPNGMYAVKRH